MAVGCRSFVVWLVHCDRYMRQRVWHLASVYLFVSVVPCVSSFLLCGAHERAPVSGLLFPLGEPNVVVVAAGGIIMYVCSRARMCGRAEGKRVVRLAFRLGAQSSDKD